MDNSIDLISNIALNSIPKVASAGDAYAADSNGSDTMIHSRFADFFNNLIMLLVAVPFILSRERDIKVSAGLAMLMAAGTFIFIYLSRYIGLHPVLAAWLPILVLGPVSAVMLDAIKT